MLHSLTAASPDRVLRLAAYGFVSARRRKMFTMLGAPSFLPLFGYDLMMLIDVSSSKFRYAYGFFFFTLFRRYRRRLIAKSLADHTTHHVCTADLLISGC